MIGNPLLLSLMDATYQLKLKSNSVHKFSIALVQILYNIEWIREKQFTVVLMYHGICDHDLIGIF